MVVESSVRRVVRRWFAAGAVGVVAVSAAGPSSASAPPDDSAPVIVPSGGGPVADASAILPAVDLQATGADFAPLAEATAMPVAVGDVLRTDGTGYAEVAYTDGSITRLDVDTEFTVVALTDDAGVAHTRTEMGVGRTWHRIESVGSGDGGFSVETSVATATVVGTAFAIECPLADSCSFLVVEGTVQLELLDGTVLDVVAPASVGVTAGVVTGPTPLPWDAVFGDPWLVDNTDRDVTAGFADRATLYQAYGPAFASMAGHYVGTTTISDLTCVSYCLAGSGPENIGVAVEFDSVFSNACVEGACAMVGSSGIPYQFDGATYTLTVPQDSNPCVMTVFDVATSEVLENADSGTVLSSTSHAFAPTAASVVDGTYAVTSILIHQVRTDTVDGFCAEEPPGVETQTMEELLALPPWLGSTVVYDGTAMRQ